eukprot:5043704-Amphidinium_carterae.1
MRDRLCCPSGLLYAHGLFSPSTATLAVSGKDGNRNRNSTNSAEQELNCRPPFIEEITSDRESEECVQ